MEWNLGQLSEEKLQLKKPFLASKTEYFIHCKVVLHAGFNTGKQIHIIDKSGQNILVFIEQLCFLVEILAFLLFRGAGRSSEAR